MRRGAACAVLGLFLVVTHSLCLAQSKGGGQPPAQVRIAPVRPGEVTPDTKLVGTVYFVEVSEVATEVSGKVEEVNYEEGKRVEKEQVLVRLNADLLRKSLEANRAMLEQARANLSKAQKDLQRSDRLYQKNLISEERYDETRYTAMGLEQRVVSLNAELERQQLELAKKVVKAPFDGVVMEKRVDRGEWVSMGDVIADVAWDEVLEVEVNVPQKLISYIRTGMQLPVTAEGRTFDGTVFAVIPKGDVATRTFPVKLRVQREPGLLEGMETHVMMPAGKPVKALMVPRDALIAKFGREVVFAVVDGKAVMMPVEVLGYRDEPLEAGIAAEGLKPGMQVVVKGNERLRNGQPVAVQNPKQAEGQKPAHDGRAG